jgi:hypothetical protein
MIAPLSCSELSSDSSNQMTKQTAPMIVVSGSVDRRQKISGAPGPTNSTSRTRPDLLSGSVSPTLVSDPIDMLTFPHDRLTLIVSAVAD